MVKQLTYSETVQILRRINAHHGNAPIDELQARVFHDELMDSMTLREAIEAVTSFYRDNPGSWMGVGDVNRLVRARRRSLLPSERELDEMAVREGLDGDGAWAFRRELVRCVSAGHPVSDSYRLALAAARRPALGPVSSRAGGVVSAGGEGRGSSVPVRVGSLAPYGAVGPRAGAFGAPSDLKTSRTAPEPSEKQNTNNSSSST